MPNLRTSCGWGADKLWSSTGLCTVVNLTPLSLRISRWFIQVKRTGFTPLSPQLRFATSRAITYLSPLYTGLIKETTNSIN